MAGIARRWGLIAAGLCIVAGRAIAQDPPPAPSPQPSGSPGAIAGVVLKAPGGDPAAGSSVRVLDEPFAGAPPGAQTQTVTAGPDGSFAIGGLRPGNYWIVANLPGYMPTEYGQRSATGQGTSIAVAAGQRVTGVRLALTPTGTISGRVFDEDGEPAGGVQVLALRVVYRDGRPELTIAQTAMTNDRGEYRLFWLPPASYRVAAKPWYHASNQPAVNIGPPRRFGTAEQGVSPVVDRRTLENGAVVENTYVPMYAPGTADPQVATAIDLASGETANADIQLAGNRVPALHVRGFVTNTTAGPLTIVVPRVIAVPRVPMPMVAIPTAPVGADGSFDIAGVAPGPYTLYATGEPGEGVTAIDVADADVDNVVVALTNGLTIQGRITVERAATNAAVDFTRLRVLLERDPDVVGTPSGGLAFNPPAEADGTFTLGGVKPGDYRVSAPPILTRFGEPTGGLNGPAVPEGLRNSYVKSIRWGRADILADGLHTSTGAQGPLEVVISLGGAQIEGIVRDNARAPAVNVVVAIVPDGDNRQRLDLYKTASTDRAGRFEFHGMPPGDYTVYAWYDLERGAWQNAVFLRAFEGRGRFVRLREGLNDPLEVSVISGR